MFRFDYEGTPFRACDADGKSYVLTPLFQFRAESNASSRDPSAADCVGLRTELWQWVTREAKGRYLIIDTDPATVLSSDDPAAL
jgi:hypothetical protein